MRIINYLFPTILIVFVFFSSKAQDKIVHGTVTTFDSILINNASVKVRSTKQIVFTDSLGNFSVGVANKDILVVNVKGFYKKSVKLEEKTRFAAINLVLKPGDQSKMYAIGNGHITDNEKFNSLALLNKNSKDYSMYRNVFEIVQSQFSGVLIVNGHIRVHGASSLYSSEANAAILIIDGVVVNESTMNSIPTAQIKSVELVKDGNAAIYGTRGGTGVVIVETKKW